MSRYFVKGKSFSLELQNYLNKYFSIDSETGLITRRDRRNSNGSIDKDGYLILKIKRNQYKAHRIAWFLYYNEIPTLEIDHINRDRLDNRKSNLRLADRLSNVYNTSVLPNKETGVIGVYIDKCTDGLKKKYTTRHKGRTFRFYTLDEAIKFRENHGKRIK
jgi:hypothetical protein